MLILEQDECAPDSLEYFERDMKEKIGISLQEFKKNALVVENDYDYILEYCGYRLQTSADNQYWKLYDQRPQLQELNQS